MYNKCSYWKTNSSRCCYNREISLRGNIKPVGGIFEKIYGARRKGIKLVAIPKDNEKEVPLGLEDIEVKSISHIEELMEIVFEK